MSRLSLFAWALLRLVFTVGVLSLIGPPQAQAAFTTTVTNFDSAGRQLVRFDTRGNAVDAHDGHIAFFDGLYYLYGTSYDCGYEWQRANAPFCGFKVYSSTDLVHWVDRGFLFDATTTTWQSRCNGNTFGCYRPHVGYNAATRQYVLWINVYDNKSGFRVFTASRPTGPFVETAEPTLSTNPNAPVGARTHGDHALFVDDDGAGYLAYTDWITNNGDIVVERLNALYTSGSGQATRMNQTMTEAPALFKRNGTYYLTYSDPACGYCWGTGTSYRTAPSPLGPWSAGTKVTDASCGGQPAFVSPIPTTSGTAYVYGSDLWNNAAPNEALANYFWTPLTFNASGAIQPLTCTPTFSLNLSTGRAGEQQPSPDVDQSAGANGYRLWCDIGGRGARIQTFVAGRSGTLTSVAYSTFQMGHPDAGLQLSIHQASDALQPVGPALYSTVAPTHSIGWAPRDLTVYPNLHVTAGTRYGIVLKSANTTGCFGLLYNDAAPYPGGGEAYSNDGGASFVVEANRSIKFATTVSDRTPLDDQALPAGFTACAPEHGLCKVKQPSVVAYGAPGGYLYQTVDAGPLPCTVAAFGTDPVYGTLKSCFVAPEGGPSGYTFCAAKGDKCQFSGTKTVAYGSNGAFSYKQLTGGTRCSNTVFGDPFHSQAKACYVSP